MNGRKHLFIALSRKGWGETSLGVEVARQLRETGDTVSFMVHSGGLRAVSGAGFETQEVPEHIGPLIELLLDERLAGEDFASIVLSDFVTTDNTLTRFGVEPERILRYGLPVIALDTWDHDLTGLTIDSFGANRWHIGTWMKDVRYRLVPVPIGPLSASGAYCGLSSPVRLTSGVRRHIRRNLGLTDADRAVLFCTAGWQHELEHPDGRRLATEVPRLLWSYLAQAGPAVRLLHVGPAPLPLEAAGERYLWMPSMTPENFDRLLGSVDLLLSANISATTIGRAITSGVPVLAVQNSCQAQTAAEAVAAIGGCVSPGVGRWLESAAPLYRFSLWPLGYWQYLRPLLRDNPYCMALDIIELTDEARFVETCHRLLFDAQARDSALARQTEYVERVKRLPTAAQLIDGYLTSGS